MGTESRAGCISSTGTCTKGDLGQQLIALMTRIFSLLPSQNRKNLGKIRIFPMNSWKDPNIKVVQKSSYPTLTVKQ